MFSLKVSVGVLSLICVCLLMANMASASDHVPLPGPCPRLEGLYQWSDYVIQIEQKGCEQVSWQYLTGGSGGRLVYITDHQPREVGGHQVEAYFEEGALHLETVREFVRNMHVKLRFERLDQACGGGDKTNEKRVLVSTLIIDGKESPADCQILHPVGSSIL
jgi:hypothetical protein